MSGGNEILREKIATSSIALSPSSKYFIAITAIHSYKSPHGCFYCPISYR